MPARVRLAQPDPPCLIDRGRRGPWETVGEADLGIPPGWAVEERRRLAAEVAVEERPHVCRLDLRGAPRIDGADLQELPGLVR